MAVFGTQSGAIGDDVKCGFCDNCGYQNDWTQGANDIIADIIEQDFRKELREFLLSESKNEHYLSQNLDDFFSLVNQMKENDFSKLAEITCKNWMENVEGATNKANILFLALSYLVKHNNDLNQRYLGEFFDLMSDNSISRKIVLEIIKIFDIAPTSMYSNHFKNRDKLSSFKIFKGIDSKLENKIGLELANSAAETWQYAEKRLRRLEYNG